MRTLDSGSVSDVRVGESLLTEMQINGRLGVPNELSWLNGTVVDECFACTEPELKTFPEIQTFSHMAVCAHLFSFVSCCFEDQAALAL